MSKHYLMDGCKLLWAQDRLQDFLDGKRIMPQTIDMGIHKGCNISCCYCYGIKQVKSAKYIPEDRLWLLAEDAAEAGIKSIAIVGDGEPTCNLGLYPFVRKLKRLKVDCAVATNGLLLKPHNITDLTSSCQWLRFNISGIDKYDKIMGAPEGSLKKLAEVVKFAVENKHDCTIGLQAVLIPEGFSEVIPLAQVALDRGVDYLVIKQFSDAGDGMPMHFDMNAYSAVRDNLIKAQAMSTDKTKIIIKWRAMIDTKNITMHKKWEFDRCIDLPFLFQISGNGGCYPCGYMFGNLEYCYGNVTEQRLIDILRSDRYWEVIQKVSETPLPKLCQGQCRHAELGKFLYQVKNAYKGNLKEALIEVCGGKEVYEEAMTNPPQHLSFI